MGYVSKSIPLEQPIFEAFFAETDVGYVSKSGTWVVTPNASHWLGGVLGVAVPALNDEAGVGAFYVRVPGVYKLHLVSRTGNSFGIIHVFINGVDVLQIDMYDAGGAVNVLVDESLGALTAGPKVIALKMASKNASSSDYFIGIESIVVVPE